MNIDQVCTRDVVMVEESASMAAAAEIMRLCGVGTLLVTGNPPRTSEAVGILTDRDLVLKAMTIGAGFGNKRVRDVMSPCPSFVSLGADIHDAFAIMRAGGLRRLIVTGEDDGDRTIAGILSLDDVVDALAAEFSGQPATG